MKSIEERLAVIERTQYFLIAIIIGQTGIQFVPMLIALLI